MGVAVRGQTNPWDDAVHDAVLRHRDPVLDGLARMVTTGGSPIVAVSVVLLAGTTVFLARHCRDRITPVVIAVSVTAVETLRFVVIVALRRPRPPIEDWATGAAGWSFPSGHTTMATVTAGVIVWTVHLLSRRRRLRLASWAVAATGVGLVGWSRIWLGVHWPLDVLGGVLFGAGGTLLAVAVAEGLSDRGGADDTDVTEPVVTGG